MIYIYIYIYRYIYIYQDNPKEQYLTSIFTFQIMWETSFSIVLGIIASTFGSFQLPPRSFWALTTMRPWRSATQKGRADVFFSVGWINYDQQKRAGTSPWLVGVWLPWFLFSHDYWEFHHPNWRTHIFQRGGPTTNQPWIFSLRYIR